MHPGIAMSDSLTERLNKILPKITSYEFLNGSGIGNEIAFYIFDYPPEQELRVREHTLCIVRSDSSPGLHPEL